MVKGSVASAGEAGVGGEEREEGGEGGGDRTERGGLGGVVQSRSGVEMHAGFGGKHTMDAVRAAMEGNGED